MITRSTLQTRLRTSCGSIILSGKVRTLFAHRLHRYSITLSLLFIFSQTHAQLAPEPPAGYLAGQATHPARSPEPGLLFYLSGEQKTGADFAAGGQNLPNFLRGIDFIPDGAKGAGLRAADDQLLSYWAPGNVYAQRGTLSFFWRSRYPVGPSPFPIFRIGYADHSSWDMVWLRIDYNGKGFDAFVTDIGLARTRVSYYPDSLARPDQWTHFALSWDETKGIRFYVNGKLVKEASANGTVYDAGLDQFGPHSRIISPYQVQSEYNFVRGGDLDELRIYDRMLPDENVDQLYHLQTPLTIAPLQRDLRERRWRDEWWTRNGWNGPNEPPPLLPAPAVSIRKVEIQDAYDIKRWYWKANDGIRETTWPGVYNMSRLPGRYDYFVLPDWDTYSRSGQTIRFRVPDEPWNQVEMWGKAWGQLTYEKEPAYDTTFAVRSQHQIKSFHSINTRRGGTIRFDNALIEEPIGELGVYNVQPGKAPQGRTTEQFTLTTAPREGLAKPLQDLAAFIDGRYPPDEQTKMTGVLSGSRPAANLPASLQPALPFIHIILPYGSHPGEGLDGIELELPALSVQPTHGSLFPMNVCVKDPLWPLRDLADVSFSVKPGSAYTLWIDTRDRVLPDDHALYITLCGAGADLTPALLTGAVVRLVYTSREKARLEHEPDRTTQIRDLYGFTVEERPLSSRLNLYNRFAADDSDLLKVNPSSFLGKAYKWVLTSNPKDRPDYLVPATPAGVPQWAFLQAAYLHKLATVLNFYIDKRQISNGEFGGGLSDDDDFTNLFPGMALMGIEPDKVRRSLQRFMKGFYDAERSAYDVNLRQPSLPLFTNGLATIKTDLLHAYEEGIEAVGQLQLVDYGNPLHLVRGMQIAKRVMDDVTGKNAAGHRHFRSRFYGGTGIATEDPWQWSGANSYHVLHPAYNIVRYNGNPALSRMVTEVADGLMAHQDKNGLPYTDIHFSTDQVRGTAGIQNTWQIFKAAYDFSGDKKYLQPIASRRLDDVHVFNKDSLVKRYTERIKDLGAREFINTDGSVWIDRVVSPNNDLQTDRLGGVALARIQNIYQQHYLGWKINKPAGYESVALFVTKANASHISLLAYNLDPATVTAEMTLWNIQPGRWRIRQGQDVNDDQQIDAGYTERLVDLERGESLKPLFPPHKTTILELELVTPAKTDYSQRPDLGMDPEGVRVEGDTISVRVYSLGAIDAPATVLVVKDAKGVRIATASVPALQAPVDLLPRWVEVKIRIPARADVSSGSVELDPEKKMVQITRLNDRVQW